MATAGGRDGAPLKQQLLEEAQKFDFFQAVRLLERLAREEADDGAAWDKPVGHDHDPKKEAIRFRAYPSHRFPAAEVREINEHPKSAAGEPIGSAREMTVAFMGLTGPCGVLPPHYTSLLIERIRAKDYALRDFFDLFNHRTISLFYRAWEKYRFFAGYERAGIAGDAGDDLFTSSLFSVVGLGTGGLRERMAFDDQAFLFYGGHFSRCCPSAVSLEQIVADYFGLPVGVSQFLGRWLYLDREDQSAMPSGEFPGGLNNQLGANVLVGERIWDVEGKFRVRMGPMKLDRFREFMPTSRALRPLCQMIRSYVGPQFDFDVQLVLAGDEVPWCVLGSQGADAPRLGWNIWMRSRSFEHNVSDAVFSLEGESWITEC